MHDPCCMQTLSQHFNVAHIEELGKGLIEDKAGDTPVVKVRKHFHLIFVLKNFTVNYSVCIIMTLYINCQDNDIKT